MDTRRARGLRSVAKAGEGAGQSQHERNRQLAQQTSAAGNHYHQWRGQFFAVGASLLPLSGFPHATRAHQRRDGLRRARRRGRSHRATQAPSGHVCRRWRFFDERAGTRHRDAIQREADCDRGQQRHVRHHPHASGTPLPHAHQRHHAEKPGFRRTRARLRPARRNRRSHRGF